MRIIIILWSLTIMDVIDLFHECVRFVVMMNRSEKKRNEKAWMPGNIVLNVGSRWLVVMLKIAIVFRDMCIHLGELVLDSIRRNLSHHQDVTVFG